MSVACCIGTILIFSDAVWRGPAVALERELRAPCVCVEHIDLGSNATVVWGQRGYFERIRSRLSLFRQRLQQQQLLPPPEAAGAADAAGWLALFDADIVALRNVSARIQQTFVSRPHVELLAQQEWPCASAPHRPCLNGGLWAVRRSARGLALVQRAERLLDWLRITDQDALQIVAHQSLAAHSGSVAFFDRQRYANGCTACGQTTAWAAHTAHLLHVNWVPSLECKLQWLAHVRKYRFHLPSSYTETTADLQRRCGVSLRICSATSVPGTLSVTSPLQSAHGEISSSG